MGSKRLQRIVGRGVSSSLPLSGKRNDDLNDISVVELSPEVVESVSEMHQFLPISEIDVNDVVVDTTRYQASGYPTSKDTVNRSERSIRATPYSVLTSASNSSVLSKAGLNRFKHIALNFNRHKLRTHDGMRVTFPKPHGMSGGGVFRIWPRQFLGTNYATRLVGVILEYRKDSSLMIAVRIVAAVAAMRHLRPDLSDLLPASKFVSIQQSTPNS